MRDENSYSTQQTEGQPPNTKLDLVLFQRGLSFVGIEADSDEVECILANMIYKVRWEPKSRLCVY